MKHQVVEAISDAWKDVHYTQVIDQCLRDYSPHPEEQEAKRLFLGRTWGDIPDEVLKNDMPNPFLIGPTALRYYMPAFLISAIREERWCELLERLVDRQLRVPMKKMALEHFKKHFDPFSQPQRMAITNFLRFASTFYADDSRVKARINDSIVRYWGRTDG